MAHKPILLFGDPRLVAPNAPVESFAESLRKLVEDLFERAWNAPGIGLAAPQIGVNLRLAVIDTSVGKDPEARIVIANPQVVSTEGRASVEEGCLSFPGLYTTLTRPRRVVVIAQDENGCPRELAADGLLAQALCHEIDHLEGRLLVDRLTGLRRRSLLRRVAKMRSLGVWAAPA